MNSQGEFCSTPRQRSAAIHGKPDFHLCVSLVNPCRCMVYLGMQAGQCWNTLGSEESEDLMCSGWLYACLHFHSS